MALHGTPWHSFCLPARTCASVVYTSAWQVDWKRWQDSDDEDEGKQNAWNLDGLPDMFGPSCAARHMLWRSSLAGLGDMNFGDMGAEAEYDSDDEARIIKHVTLSSC